MLEETGLDKGSDPVPKHTDAPACLSLMAVYDSNVTGGPTPRSRIPASWNICVDHRVASPRSSLVFKERIAVRFAMTLT